MVTLIDCYVILTDNGCFFMKIIFHAHNISRKCVQKKIENLIKEKVQM